MVVMKNLVLVGFMGSGKTSAGQLAAQRLGLQFVDMDAVIEQRTRQTVSQIFETQGEPAFRKIEREVVIDLAARDGLVIATGGGVVLNPDNIRDFSRTGVVISLWVDPRVAFERTKRTSHRPLLATDDDRLSRLESLLKQREPLYKAIKPCLDTSALSVEQQADEIVRIYRQQL